MNKNITDKEKKEIEEMTNELVAIVPMVKPKEDSYTDYCKQIATALRNVGYRKETIIVKEFAEKLTKAFYELEQDNYKAGRKESAFGVMCAGHLVYEIAKEFGAEEK